MSATEPDPIWSVLPLGAEVARGIADLRGGRETPEACLASIASRHLKMAGVPGVKNVAPLEDAEIRLYRLLQKTHADPYGAYNSLLRRLVRFERALHTVTSQTLKPHWPQSPTGAQMRG